MNLPATDQVTVTVSANPERGTSHVHTELKISAHIDVDTYYWHDKGESAKEELIKEAVRITHAAVVREVYREVHEAGRKLMEAVFALRVGEATLASYYGPLEEVRSIAMRLMNYGKTLPAPKIRVREVGK